MPHNLSAYGCAPNNFTIGINQMQLIIYVLNNYFLLRFIGMIDYELRFNGHFGSQPALPFCTHIVFRLLLIAQIQRVKINVVFAHHLPAYGIKLSKNRFILLQPLVYFGTKQIVAKRIKLVYVAIHIQVRFALGRSANRFIIGICS